MCKLESFEASCTQPNAGNELVLLLFFATITFFFQRVVCYQHLHGIILFTLRLIVAIIIIVIHIFYMISVFFLPMNQVFVFKSLVFEYIGHCEEYIPLCQLV